jgi:hypothetical protein
MLRIFIGCAVLCVCRAVRAVLAFRCLFLASCNAGLDWLENHIEELGD